MAYIYKTKTEQRKRLSITLGIAGAIIAVVTLYLVLAFNALFAGFFRDFGKISVIKNGIEKAGFPALAWILVFSLLYLIFVLLVMRWYDEKSREDPLGRGFIFAKGNTPYGNAHFGQPEEYIENALVDTIDDACGTILGKIDDNDSVINLRLDKGYRFNNNIICVGSTGSGKTYSFVKPYIYQMLRRRESGIIPDPDGGLSEDTQGLAQRLGYVTRRLDMVDIMKSDGWHCLASVTGENAVKNAQIFADTVVKSGMGGENASDIYVSAPKSLLVALILRVMLGTDYPPEKKHIGTVFDLLHNENGMMYYTNTLFNPVMLKANNCMEARKPFLAFAHASANLAGNIITHLATQMGALQDQLLAEVLSTNEIDLELPGKVPCIYYCIFPDSDENYKFISSIFFSMLFTSLMRLADRSPGRRLPVPVNFVLDEFPQYYIPAFDKKMNVIRKRDIKVAIVVQSYGQLEDMYGKKADAIFNACSTVVFRGTQDEETAKKIATRCGKTTAVVKTYKGDSFGIALNPTTQGTGQRELMSQTDVQEINVNNTLLILQTQQPVLCHAFAHTEHPLAKLVVSMPKDKLPDFIDKPGKIAARIREQKRIAGFYDEHPECLPQNIDRSYKYQEEKAEAIEKANQDLFTRLNNWKKERAEEINEIDSDEDSELELYDDYSEVTEDDFEIDAVVVDRLRETLGVESITEFGIEPLMPWDDGSYQNQIAEEPMVVIEEIDENIADENSERMGDSSGIPLPQKRSKTKKQEQGLTFEMGQGK